MPGDTTIKKNYSIVIGHPGSMKDAPLSIERWKIISGSERIHVTRKRLIDIHTSKDLMET